MRLLVFPQYAKLIAHFRAVASTCAAEKARWPICRVEAQNGVAHLHDHAMNVLALTGGTTTIILPDIIGISTYGKVAKIRSVMFGTRLTPAPPYRRQVMAS